MNPAEKIMFETKSNPTRIKLIERAEKLFWFKGYKATSIDDIAQAANQSKGAFFHYFSSKKEITLLALNQYAEEEIFQSLDKHFTQHTNTKEALLSWAQEIYTSYGNRNYHAGCFLGNMALEMSEQDEEFRLEIARLFLEWENRLAGYFRDSNRSGEILMDPRQFARIVISSLQGLMMSIKVHRDKRRAAREFQALAEFFERLIKG